MVDVIVVVDGGGCDRGGGWWIVVADSGGCDRGGGWWWM